MRTHQRPFTNFKCMGRRECGVRDDSHWKVMQIKKLGIGVDCGEGLDEGWVWDALAVKGRVRGRKLAMAGILARPQSSPGSSVAMGAGP